MNCSVSVAEGFSNVLQSVSEKSNTSERRQEKLDNGCQADPVPVFQKHIAGLGPGYYPIKA